MHSVNAATNQGFNDNPLGLVFQGLLRVWIGVFLKDQPYGVVIESLV